MFFSVSKSAQKNFPYSHKTEHFYVNLDEGWHQQGNTWYKGYVDQGQLADKLPAILNETEPTHTGNFCVINVVDGGVRLHSDRLRSFPLYYNQALTNLDSTGETIWTDCYVQLNNDLSLSRNWFDPIGPIDETTLTLEEVVEQVDSLLSAKAQAFLSQQTTPIKVFLSGGMDTALVFSYIQKYAPYELVLNQHLDYDYFYLKNHGTLEQFWGYRQIHHWRDSSVLASGAPGDEFTARSPATANLLLLHYGTNIPRLLADSAYNNCLHRGYFSKPEYMKNWNQQQDNYVHNSLAGTINTCLNMNLNDWQHWHLGQTLTWTPLRDIELFKLVARLRLPDLKEQVMNSIVQKRLIEKNNPKILTYLSTQKNSVNYLENLADLLVRGSDR
jgi:hypothetical protein